MAGPWFGVLIDKATGVELPFHHRGEYLATLYGGGYRAKNLDEPTPPAPARARAPRPRAPAPPEQPAAEPVNDEPVVETAPDE